MELILTIEKSASPWLEGTSYRFDENGGSFGRSEANDWVLDDPTRYTSGRHARIDFEQGEFVLTDLSTNGTYVNSRDNPIGRQQSRALESGDKLLIGKFVIDVAIEGKPGEPSAAPRPAQRAPAADPKRPTPSPTPAMGISAFVSEDDADRDRAPLAPTPAYGMPALDAEPDEDPPRVPRRDAQGAHGSPACDDSAPDAHNAGPADDAVAAGLPAEWREAAAQLFGAGGPIPDREPQKPTEARAASAGDASEDPLVAALVQELGLDIDIDSIDREAFGRDIARVLRRVTEGLMQLLQSRATVKGEYRIEQTRMTPTGNSPLKFSPSVQSALHRVLVDAEGDAYLRGVRAFDDAFEDLRRHELAILAAVHASIGSVIEELNPQRLQQRLQTLSRFAAGTPVLREIKCWTLYRERYSEIAAQWRDDAKDRFLAEFARAYERAAGGQE